MSLDLKRMFLRLVIHKNDRNSGRRQGLFQAMSDLEHEGVLLAHEQDAYDEIYDWFRKHLKKPRSFTRSSKPHAKTQHSAGSNTARLSTLPGCIALAQILQAHGVVVDALRSERPGYLVYEDEFRVAAEPFKEAVT